MRNYGTQHSHGWGGGLKPRSSYRFLNPIPTAYAANDAAEDVERGKTTVGGASKQSVHTSLKQYLPCDEPPSISSFDLSHGLDFSVQVLFGKHPLH